MRSTLFDYHTLFLASGIVAATLLTLLAIQARKTYAGYVKIVVAIDLLTAAVVTADLRGYVSDALWGIQVAALFAFALVDNGIRSFCATPRRGRWPYVYVAAAILLQTFLFLTQPLHIRILFNSLLLIPIFIDSALPFLRTPPKGCRFGYRFTAAVLMLGCATSCVRIVAVYYLREHPSPYFSGHPANTLFFFLIMLLLVALAFGFIALTHERLVLELGSEHERWIEERDERASFERELTQAERLTHARFKALFDQSPAFAAIMDLDGTVREVSRAPMEICGYTREQVIGRPFWQTPLWRSSNEVQEKLRTATAQAATGQTYRAVLPYVSADDSAHVVDFGIYPIFDDSGNVIFLHPTGVDITERVSAEQALRETEERDRLLSEHLLLALEASQSGTFEWKIRENVRRWGPTIEKLYGFEPGTFPGTYEAWRECIHPEDVARVEEAVTESLKTGIIKAEFRVRRKNDGQTRWMLSNARVHFDQEGKPERMIGINVDVTERKRMEEALLESESRFRSFMDNSPAIAWMKDAQGKYVYCSRAFESYFGMRLEDCRDKTDFDIFPADLAQLYVDHDRSALATNSPVQVFEESPNSDGSVRTNLVTKFPFSTTGGERFVAGIGLDITDQKRSEEKIKLSEQRYRSLVRASAQLVWSCNADGTYSRDIDEWQHFTGQTSEQMRGQGWSDAIHPDDLDKVLKAWQRALETKSTYTIEHRIRRNDGAYRTMQVRGTPVLDSSGQVAEWVGMCIDVTEQRHAEERERLAEEKIRLSEQRYRSLVSASSQLVWICDADGNPKREIADWRLFTGQTSEQLTGQGWLNAVHPDDRDRTLKAWKHALETKSSYTVEYRLRRTDGVYRTMHVRAAPVLDSTGKVAEWIGMNTDVSERTLADEALRQSEERFRLLFENAPLGIVLVDQKGSVTAANRMFAEMSGYSIEGAVGLTSTDISPVEDRAATRELEEGILSGRLKTTDRDRRLLRKDGSTAWIRMTTTFIRDNLGKAQWGIAVFQDVHERKRAEEAIRQSEERFRLLFENAPLGVILIDQKGNLTSANRKFAELSGYSQEEAVGLSSTDLAPPEDAAATRESLEKLLDGKTRITDRERRLLRKDGSTIWARVTATIMRDNFGKPQWGIVALQDINEKKEAEEAIHQSEERFRLLFENAPVGVMLIDRNGHLTSANRKFTEILGYSPEEAAGFAYIDLAAPEDRHAANEIMLGLLSGKIETSNRERRLMRKDGGAIWARLTTRIMRDNLGEPQWGIVAIEDTTERKLAEEALRQSEEKFRATLEHAPIGIAECTVDGKFMNANSKLSEILGYSNEEIARLTVIDVTHPGDVEESLSCLQRLIDGKEDIGVMEKRYIRRDRSFVWANTTASLVTDDGKPQYLIIAVEDITARKRAEEDLKRAIESSYYDANHDTLTGLANRASFRDRLSEALAYAKRDGHLVAIHLLDLDRFKSINDTLGHDIGDLLLQVVAKRIKSHIRATDLAARLGGDEFAVIQSHLADPSAAGVLAGKLVEDLARKYAFKENEVQSGTSIGIAIYPNDAEDPESLMKRADLALYDAKHRGRFNYQFYRKDLGVAFSEAQQREQELMRALRENQFLLHYQPQFDLKSGRITGVEALLRWCHPQRGQLSAAEFIRDAERARLMLPIGEWVIQTACRQYKEWTDSGFTVPLTLNLSSAQLQDPRLLDTLKRILEETGLPASMLQVEMRESVLWEPKFSKNLLDQMKANGLHLALDNFGSEMTALPTLDKFPLDVVKPDQGLVRALPTGKREAALLDAIIGVAHDLKIAVCADGIETAGQLAAAKEHGCDSVQGYLLSWPLNENAMKQRIDLDLAH
jgi:diguanylate cyclase (GGDEF)-like protein/PAS domain S-box-containing protein